MTSPLSGLDVTEDGARLLEDVCATLRWWVKFPSPEAADAVALYVAVTYAAAQMQFAPRLRIKSPQKRCGKTRLVEVVSWLVHDPLRTVNISAAALARSIGDDPPTVMLDEADTIFGKGLKGDEKAETLRGLLNAGFDRSQPYTRWDATTRQLDQMPTFALAVIAGIGDLPDTIEDRAVPLTLTRKTGDETCSVAGPHGPCVLVHKFRPRRDVPTLRELRDRVTAWVTPRAETIGAAEPGMPDGLSDRAEDVWESLIAVADLAGGDWPARARQAAVSLMSEAETSGADRSTGMRLLKDLRDVFDAAVTDRMITAEVITSLCKIEESPWRTINRGFPIDPSGLAERLRPFDVSPTLMRPYPGAQPARGYYRASFEDVWKRYLPPVTGRDAVTGVTAVTPQVNPVMANSPVTPPGVTALQPQAADLRRNAVTAVTGNTARNGSQDFSGSPEYDFADLWKKADHGRTQS